MDKEVDKEALYMPQEVADMFRVDVTTVAKWADKGILQVVRTAGGHRRYIKKDVDELRYSSQHVYTDE